MALCRCPECGHIRGEAADGSTVRLQCRQCKIKFDGRVHGGKFVVTSHEKIKRSFGSSGPPSYIG